MSMPPNQQPPYPQQPAPAKKGMPLWLWLVFGFGAVCLIGVIGLAVFTWYLADKLNTAAKNPVATMVRIAAAANPDIEVLDVNEETGKVTVRDRKTGKTTVINAERFGKDGKIDIQSEDGNLRLGSGSSFKPPAWVILPAGAQITGGMSADDSGGVNGSVLFTSSDSIEELKANLEEAYRSAGYEVKSTLSSTDSGAGGVHLAFENTDRGRTVTANLAKTPDGAGGTLGFSEKGQRGN